MATTARHASLFVLFWVAGLNLLAWLRVNQGHVSEGRDRLCSDR